MVARAESSVTATGAVVAAGVVTAGFGAAGAGAGFNPLCVSVTVMLMAGAVTSPVPGTTVVAGVDPIRRDTLPPSADA